MEVAVSVSVPPRDDSAESTCPLQTHPGFSFERIRTRMSDQDPHRQSRQEESHGFQSKWLVVLRTVEEKSVVREVSVP